MCRSCPRPPRTRGPRGPTSTACAAPARESEAGAGARGGGYGCPRGTRSGMCRRRALDGNEQGAREAVGRFREAAGGDVRELAARGGPTRLHELGVPEDDLPELAESAAGRPGNRANPRPATPSEVEALLRSIF